MRRGIDVIFNAILYVSHFSLGSPKEVIRS